MKAMTLKEYVEKYEHAVVECAYCGRKLAEPDVHWIGCCPLCENCYRRLKKE